jgi:hypothetical protein
MENLDLKCAEVGRELAGIADEKAFTSALGVLEEQGPYACFLYLKAREGQNGGKIVEKSTGLLRDVFRNQAQSTDGLAYIKSLANDLDKLLFARDLLRQMFIYARYHAKEKAATQEER